MKHELKLSNKEFAESLTAYFIEGKNAASIAEVDGKFVLTYEIKADAPPAQNSPTNPNTDPNADMNKKLGDAMEYVCSRMDRMHSNLQQNMYAHIDRLYAAHSEHQKGHLPPLSPSGMGKLIKAAGQDGDYQVKPKTVYASNGAIEFSTEELCGALTRLNAIDDKPNDPEVNRLIEIIKKQRKV